MQCFEREQQVHMSGCPCPALKPINSKNDIHEDNDIARSESSALFVSSLRFSRLLFLPSREISSNFLLYSLLAYSVFERPWGLALHRLRVSLTVLMSLTHGLLTARPWFMHDMSFPTGMLQQLAVATGNHIHFQFLFHLVQYLNSHIHSMGSSSIPWTRAEASFPFMNDCLSNLTTCLFHFHIICHCTPVQLLIPSNYHWSPTLLRWLHTDRSFPSSVSLLSTRPRREEAETFIESTCTGYATKGLLFWAFAFLSEYTWKPLQTIRQFLRSFNPEHLVLLIAHDSLLHDM